MLAIEMRAIGNDRAAQRAIDAGDFHPADLVHEHFVPGEDALGIGMGLAIHDNAEDDIVIAEIIGLARAQHFGIAQRRDAVLQHAAPDDFVEPDARIILPAVEIGPETRIDGRIERGFEQRVIIRDQFGLLPQPARPVEEIRPQFLAGFLPQQIENRLTGVEAARKADGFEQLRDIGGRPVGAHFAERGIETGRVTRFDQRDEGAEIDRGLHRAAGLRLGPCGERRDGRHRKAAGEDDADPGDRGVTLFLVRQHGENGLSRGITRRASAPRSAASRGGFPVPPGTR